MFSTQIIVTKELTQQIPYIASVFIRETGCGRFMRIIGLQGNICKASLSEFGAIELEMRVTLSPKRFPDFLSSLCLKES